MLDKATLDALICVDEEEDASVQQMLNEVWRVLKPGGRYVCISNSDCRDLILSGCDDDGTAADVNNESETGQLRRCWQLTAVEIFKHASKKQKFWLGLFEKPSK